MTGPEMTGPDPATGPDMDERPAGTTPRGARTMVVVGAVFAVLGVVGWIFGFVGMVLGTLAHAKGDRLGLPVSIVAGATMIVGMAVLFFTNA